MDSSPLLIAMAESEFRELQVQRVPLAQPVPRDLMEQPGPKDYKVLQVLMVLRDHKAFQA
jgi:hypothetical protein